MSHKAILLGAAASIAILASTVAANAGHRGWYLNVEGGASWVEDFDVDFFTGPAGGPVTTSNTVLHLETQTGWVALASVGYGFGNHFRVELEGGYRRNNLDRLVSTGVFSSSPSGDLTEWTIMANALYDISLTDRFGLTLGVGAGGDNARLKYTDSAPVVESVDDGDWNFAYQGIVGLSYALGPQTDITLNYRYLRVQEPSWSDTFAASDFSIDAEDLAKHAVTIGLRYDLWPDEEEPMAVVSTPAPELPPAPPAQSFMIFFGFNKCNITPEADNVLSQAADAARQMGSATVQIVGHTDTVGSDRYNKKLSVCRAHAAKSNLVGKGVAENSIATSGKGESELLVQTADGVKEPQNRRATIDLQ